MNFREAQARADRYRQTLRVGEPAMFHKTVLLALDDGTSLLFTDAHLWRLDDEWLACFTEHHNYHVYHMSDVDWFAEFDRWSGGGDNPTFWDIAKVPLAPELPAPPSKVSEVSEVSDAVMHHR